MKPGAATGIVLAGAIIVVAFSVSILESGSTPSASQVGTQSSGATSTTASVTSGGVSSTISTTVSSTASNTISSTAAYPSGQCVKVGEPFYPYLQSIPLGDFVQNMRMSYQVTVNETAMTVTVTNPSGGNLGARGPSSMSIPIVAC